MGKTAAYRVIVSNRARDMLKEHIRFLAVVSVPAAQKLNKELAEALRSLSRMPERHPFLEGPFIPFNKYRKMLAANRYLLIYQMDEQTVYVDFVIDCRQDYGWLIK